MQRKAIKLEFEDNGGAKYFFKLEGSVSRDKIIRLLDMYEIISESESKQIPPKEDSIIKRIEKIINDFSTKKFSSKTILEAYEDKFKEGIKLSIISTYLRRLSDKGQLVREKRGKEWIYYHPELLKVLNKRISHED
ncbi:MAG: hypothetical protein ACP5TZ_00140 [Nitrososphaeria archaeon]